MWFQYICCVSKLYFSSYRSVSLLMQLALPCLLYAPETSKLILKGGTNAEMAPPIDYMTDVSAEATIFF